MARVSTSVQVQFLISLCTLNKKNSEVILRIFKTILFFILLIIIFVIYLFIYLFICLFCYINFYFFPNISLIIFLFLSLLINTFIVCYLFISQRQQDLLLKEGKFKQIKIQELIALQKRIQTGREEQKKQRHQDLERYVRMSFILYIDYFIKKN